MDFYEAVEKRRTIRAFTKRPSEKVLRKVILTGTKALSGANRQHWEYIIVDDPKLIDQIAEQKYQMNVKISPEPDALKQKNAYQNCSVVAVCHKEGGLSAAWMSVQNMALAATVEGLGIVPSTLSGEHKKAVEKLLGLPDGYELATVMLIGVQEGYPKKFPAPQRRPEFSWLHRNKFGTPA